MNQVLRAILITLIVSMVAFGGLYLLRGDTTGLRRPAVEFVEKYWAGGAIENDLSVDFKGPATQEGLDQQRRMFKQRFGEFEGAGEPKTEWTEDQVGQLVLDLEFEKSSTEATFDFVYERGQWRILRFTLDLPRSTAPKADYTDPKIFSEKLLTHWARGRPLMAWEHFDHAAREPMHQDIFSAKTKDFARERGEIAEVKRTGMEDDGGDRVALTYDLVFPESMHEARVELRWANGRWLVSRFDVDDFGP